MLADPYGWNEEELNQIYMTSVGRLLFDLWNVEGVAGLEMLKEIGFPVTAAHINIVPHIDIGGTRLTELARRARLTKQSVWEALKNMEAQGYIARTADPSDARAALISWTAKGIEFLRLVCLGVVIREDDLARRIGKKNAKTLKDLLAKARESYAKQPPAVTQLVAQINLQQKGRPARSRRSASKSRTA